MDVQSSIVQCRGATEISKVVIRDTIGRPLNILCAQKWPNCTQFFFFLFKDHVAAWCNFDHGRCLSCMIRTMWNGGQLFSNRGESVRKMFMSTEQNQYTSNRHWQSSTNRQKSLVPSTRQVSFQLKHTHLSGRGYQLRPTWRSHETTEVYSYSKGIL